MRGRTNMAAGGGGAEPVYGILQPGDISLSSADSNFTITLPENIKTLCGFMVIIGRSNEKENIYCYPCADIGDGSVTPAQDKAMRILMYYTGERIDYGVRDMTVQGKQITVNGGTLDLSTPKGGAYMYIPE